jgi:hypothetical protein
VVQLGGLHGGGRQAPSFPVSPFGRVVWFGLLYGCLCRLRVPCASWWCSRCLSVLVVSVVPSLLFLNMKHVRLLPVQDFISLFPRMSCDKKCFETVNETTPKMHDFILKFYNTKFYVVPSVVYVMK